MKEKYVKPVLKVEQLFDNIGMRCYNSGGWGWYSDTGCT